MTGPTLSDRSRRVLALLVREYIERGEPVSSLWIARRGGLGLSSATVRSILARLEELGCVYQPHTSAGRVPTDLGYRCYVDQLLQGRRAPRLSPAVEARLRQAGTVEDVLANLSQELSRASHQVGFAVAATDASSLQHIDFVPLDGTRVLVVVIATGGQICHKVIELEEAVRAVDLEQAANFLNTEFAGLPLPRVREAVLARLAEERMLYDALMSRALQLASTTFMDLPPQSAVVIQGTSLLLEDVTEEGRQSLETLRALFRMIEDKHRLVQLLNEYIEGNGVTVVIGTEHSSAELQPFSLVVSSYSQGQQSGTMGVLGPTRMRYSRAISAVDSVSLAVSRALTTDA
jgi:heat-inducible transcriptional repressor